MTPIIETKGLRHRYGREEAVKDLNLVVPQGSIFALLGPNGAGKTTTLKMLMNIIRPTGGEATVLGTPSTRLAASEFQQIGYISENQDLPEWMTVEQFMAYCRPLYPTWDDDFCRRLMEQFQLPPHRKLKHLSRGMKMKAALMSSLAFRPKLLVLDEPFSGLDPLARDEFVSGVLTLAGEGDWTIVVSSHDIQEVERLVDWVGFLEKGRLRFCESVMALQDRIRRLEAVLDVPAEFAAPPDPHWLSVEIAPHSLRLVDLHYQEGASQDRLRAAYPGVRDIQASPLTLREIFVALARQPQDFKSTP